jgi:hypothetical protein
VAEWRDVPAEEATFAGDDSLPKCVGNVVCDRHMVRLNGATRCSLACHAIHKTVTLGLPREDGLITPTACRPPVVPSGQFSAQEGSRTSVLCRVEPAGKRRFSCMISAA